MAENNIIVAFELGSSKIAGVAAQKNPDGSLTERGKDIVRKTPFGRFGEPEEVFGAVRFLCSDASKFITGTVLAIDGGFSCFSGV